MMAKKLLLLALLLAKETTAFNACISVTPRCTTFHSTPGGWDNDDFLNSLSGGEDNGGGDTGRDSQDDQNQQQPESIVPENNMIDEEITLMAMRSAQYYNTDTSLEEAYGTPREQHEND